MKKAILFLALGSAMQLALSCHHADDVQPASTVNRQAANYDVLANATGHWQWKESLLTADLSPTIVKDSAKVGYGRQLRFRSDSTLLLRRTGRADTLIKYSFVVSNTLCSQPYNTKWRAVVYSTKEPLLPVDDRKKCMATNYALSVTGESALCNFGGWHERYLWVPEP